MLSRTVCSLAVVIIGVLIAAWNKQLLDYLGEFRSLRQNITLAVCILSAQHHFEHRKAIRKSWMTDIHKLQKTGKQVVAKFVVGRESCLIHPENRLDVHDCQRWEPSMPETYQDIPAFKLTSQIMKTNGDASVVAYHVYVKVMSEIVLRRLGLAGQLGQLTFPLNGSSRVILYDAATEEEITHAEFSSHGRVVGVEGYMYRPVEELLLPRGFEFILAAEVPGVETRSGELDSWSSMVPGTVAAVPAHHNFVFTQVTDRAGRVITDGHTAFIPAASFIFSLADAASAQHHIDTISERDSAWATDLARTSQALDQEIARYGDVMLLDLQDTYRNLPLKVALCHQRFQSDSVPGHVMKTDDDCYVNLPEIVRSLEQLPRDAFAWWGNFRDYWAVERQGKWREDSYSSSVYPRFACGSGYVLSAALSSWLAENTRALRMFQGEDVSMGIWLAGLKVRHLQDTRWRCDLTCQDGQLSLPELTPELVTWHWNNSRSCPGSCYPC